MNQTPQDFVPKIVFVGTFPPTDEGIATFNFDLLTATQKLIGKNAKCIVCAVNLADTSPYYFDPRVEWEIDQNSKRTYLMTAEEISKDPEVVCVIIQHEYGIFGGVWGEYVLDFMGKVGKPIITILHSVLKSHEYKPEIFQKVTHELLSQSDLLITLVAASKELLVQSYPVDSQKIVVIRHGIHPTVFESPQKMKKELGLEDKTVLTTFGLLSRDKGIEYVIKALPGLIKKNPDILYQVLGQTHPTVRKNEGEKYRMELIALVRKLKLRKHVYFLDKYMSLSELLTYLQGTDIYIATSTNKNQTVSGTFSYALGTGRPVVSTEFVQSKEMLTADLGAIVPSRDSKAFESAIQKLLSDSPKRIIYGRNAYRKTRSMLWTNSSYYYLKSIEKLTGHTLTLPEIDLRYMRKMTRKKALLQFAKYDIPDPSFGYTLDDNARALVVINNLLLTNYSNKRLLQKLQSYYLNFIERCQKTDGTFKNYLNYNFEEVIVNPSENLEEPFGRAVWALADTIVSPYISAITRNKARRMLRNALKSKEYLQHIRPKAFIIKGLSILLLNQRSENDYRAIVESYAQDLIRAYHDHTHKNWKWFENSLSYNNGVLPESLFWAYKATGNKNYLQIARKTLNFFLRKSFMGDIYVPIGQKGWHTRNKKRSLYDQQPEDTSAAVLTFITAFEATKNKRYVELAQKAFSWFLGNNISGIPLYNVRNGGVYDALPREGVNKNQGAEALISYLLARLRIDQYYS